MLTRQPFRITASTSAERNHSPVELGGGYRWRGTPGWRPENAGQGDRPPPNRGGQLRTEGRKQRQAEYDRLRRGGKTQKEAGAAVGVGVKTAYRYERDYLATLNGDPA